jgi:uncharacterized protein (DUF2147 family)
MKSFFGITVFAFLLFFATSVMGGANSDQNPPLGIWIPKEKDSHIEVYKNGDKYFGKIIWIQEQDKGKLDTNNPDDKLKTQPVLNLVFLNNFKEDEPGKEWSDGTVYDPHNGKTYKGKIYYRPETDTLELRGYVGIPLFGRTETWTRLKD